MTNIKLGDLYFSKDIKRENNHDIFEIRHNNKNVIINSIKETFEGENIEAQDNIYGHIYDLYFIDYNLAININKRKTNKKDKEIISDIFKYIKNSITESTKLSNIDNFKKLLKAACKFDNNRITRNFTKKIIKHIKPVIVTILTHY